MIIAFIVAIFCTAVILFMLNILRYLVFDSKIIDDKIVITFFRFVKIKTINISEISEISIGLENFSSLISYKYINRWQIPILIKTTANDKFVLTPKNVNEFVNRASQKSGVQTKHFNYMFLLKARTIFFGIALFPVIVKVISESLFFNELENTIFKSLMLIVVTIVYSLLLIFLYKYLKNLCIRRSSII